MHRYETRLRPVATQLRCCAQHGTALVCYVCTYEWTGTEAELTCLHEQWSPTLLGPKGFGAQH
jgi:hypothetical protein